MKKIFTLAQLSFRELVREKFSLALLFLALALLLLSLLLGELSLDEQARLLGDLGLASIELAAVAMALFLGSALLPKEVERQTCLLLLSRPLSRSQFLLGKVSGLALLVTLLVFGVGLFLALLLGPMAFTVSLFWVLLSILFKAWILLAFVFALSVFLRPVLAVMAGGTLYLLGHWLTDLEYFARQSGPFAQSLVQLTRSVIPNFDRFNWKSFFFIEQGPPAQDILTFLVHAASWIFILLAAAIWFFRRKDIV